MSDAEGSPQEQPDSPDEQEDLASENGDQPEDSEDADQETGSRKRSLSTSAEKSDDSPSKKVAKEEISLAIICDTHAKALEKIKQTETAIVFHLKVKVTEDLSLATIPGAVEELLSEDPETKCVVILLPQDDLRQASIPHSCKMNSCSGKGLEHTLPLPVTSLATYMDYLKKTREELMDTYPDIEFYWITPGPVDFRHLNRKEIEKKHGHSTTTDFMWKAMIANYNKRLKVIYEEIPGNMTINWFPKSCWQTGDNRYNNRKRTDNPVQRVLQGDFGPVKAAGLIEEGETLTVKGGQAIWVMICKKINWYRKLQAVEKAKAETEKEEDPSGNAATEDKNGEEVNDKAEEENDLNESQKKKLGGSTLKTTIIGDSWIQILPEIERWHPDHRNRMNVKVYPDLTMDSVIEKVDEVLSEDSDTKNLVLSVFQNDLASGLSADNVENEIIPCAYSTVDDILEKASNIGKYIKKTYPQVKVFWVTPGPVGYYSGEDKKEEEEKMEDDSNEQEKEEKKEKKEEKKEEEKEDKEDDEEKEEDDEEKEENDEEKEENDEEKEENDEEKEETIEEKTVKEAEEVEEEEEEEEEKEEDPELRKLRRACSSCNTIAMILSKRLHFRFKKQVVDWFEVFNSNRSGPGTGYSMSYSPDLEGQILEGKVVKHGYFEEDFVNLSELGGNRLMKLIITKILGEKPRNRESDDLRSPGINRRVGGMEGRNDGGRGRGSGRGRGGGGGGRKDGGMGRRPIDKRLSWDSRGGGGQHDPWGQQGGGNWKGQNRRFQNQDMRNVINRERVSSNRRGGNWGGSGHYVDPWARNDYSGYYGSRY